MAKAAEGDAWTTIATVTNDERLPAGSQGDRPPVRPCEVQGGRLFRHGARKPPSFSLPLIRERTSIMLLVTRDR